MSSSSNLFYDSTSIDSGVDDVQNPKFNYTGNFDEEGFRDGYGCQNWDRPFQHKYAGYFLYNNMHDKGFYFIRQEDSISFYDGQFYNNKLEGYGQIIYNDGRVHEGLFRDNKKFGPGVLTYPDETQDVGLWHGNHLIRLSISVSSDIVSSLCNNPSSAIKLLRYKKIVPAMVEKIDVAKDLMAGLSNNDETFAKRYPDLYNPHVRNERSLFFDRRLYDLAQLGSEDTLIEVIDDEAFVDVVSEFTDAEDDVCPCISQRCVHVTKQITELETELQKIHQMKRKYEKQLKQCKTCCTILPNSPCTKTTDSTTTNSLKDEDKKYPSEASIVEDIEPNFKQVVEKNLEQMRLQSSIVEEIILGGGGEIVTNEVTMVNRSPRKSDSINKLFMNTKQFRSDPSLNSNDHEKNLYDPFEKYTCQCMDEEIPNADFLVEKLRDLDKKEKFYHTIIDFLNRVLYKEFSSVNKSASSKLVKLQVQDLLSWNNGHTYIEMLQHSFRYRNFEKILSFNIKSLLIGDRGAFGPVGNIESRSIHFLKHCSSNKLLEVRKDLFYHNVYPDLSDARGNTGLHFACSSDCHEIIRQLANIGANLDAFNDECLTPLSLSILRYLAKLNKVSFWDKAFLSEIILNSKELEEVTQWRPHESLVSIGDFIASSPALPKDQRPSTEEIKKSSDEISAKIRSHLQSIRSNSISLKLNMNYLFSVSFVEDYDLYKKVMAGKKFEDVEGNDLKLILRTVELLLQYGADPNIGDLPMKPILLAIFSKNLNLVEILLKHNADPNSLTEDNLSPLHILASLPFTSTNVQMTEKFLKYSCDPNRKSSNELWFEQNEELVGTYLSPSADFEEYEGKTPLQMVAMRKDFDEINVEHQCDLVRVLIENGTSYDQYYLGHTILSLAVLRGNIDLIETLNRYVELGQALGENMGNALTLFGLCRFPFVKPFNICKSTIDKLIQLGMNPFNPVDNFSNIFEFFLYDYSNHIDFDIPRIRLDIEAEDATFRKAVCSSNYDFNQDCNKLSVAYLKEIGRNILMTLYRCRAMRILLLFAEQDLLYHRCLDGMAKFFTIQEAIDCLKFHIKLNGIVIDDDYKKVMVKVLNFIQAKNKDPKKPPTKTTTMAIDPPLIIEEEVSKLHKHIVVPNYIVMYALDTNPEKYEVCFHCMRGSDKKLLCCPCCGSVKFCSELCNKYNNKLGTKHTCNLLFYDEMRLAFEKPTDQLTGIDLLMSEAKQMREEERQAELLRAQAEEQEKLRKQLRKSQKMDSQLAFQDSRSRSLIEKSTSACILAEKKKPSKKKLFCCKKPSSIFVCNEKVEPRTLNCGFHCGQVIPDVQIDDECNIVREKEFCECYPLYKRDREPSETHERKESIYKPQRSEDVLSDHYEIGDIFGGALSSEERKRREEEELDMLMDTFVKEEIKESKESDVVEDIQPGDENIQLEYKSSLHEVQETEKHKGKKKTLKSESNLSTGKGKGKKKGSKHKEILDESDGKVGETPDETEEKDESKKDVKEKAGKHRKKSKSDTEITKKKKDKNKEKNKEIEGRPSKKKKSKDSESKSKSRSDLSLSDDKKKKKKKSSKKETHSESELDTDKRKKKKKGKEDKSVGDSVKHDKKTMTKEKKEKKKTRKGKESGTQVDKKSKEKKSVEKSSKSAASDKTKKPQKKKGEKQAEKKTKKAVKKEASEKKHARDLKGKVAKVKTKKEKKKRPESKKSEKISQKKISQKKISQKKISQKITRGKKAKEKVQKYKSKTEEKAPSRAALFERHLEKSKRDVAVGKNLASFKALDSSLLNTEKILTLSGSNYEEFKKISRVYQYFLELIAKYFPDFDLSCLMLPFACFMDGQLYYKFADALPYYCRTYSTM